MVLNKGLGMLVLFGPWCQGAARPSWVVVVVVMVVKGTSRDIPTGAWRIKRYLESNLGLVHAKYVL